MVDNRSYSSVLLIESGATRTNLLPTFTPHLTGRNALILRDRVASCSSDLPHYRPHPTPTNPPYARGRLNVLSTPSPPRHRSWPVLGLEEGLRTN